MRMILNIMIRAEDATSARLAKRTSGPGYGRGTRRGRSDGLAARGCGGRLGLLPTAAEGAHQVDRGEHPRLAVLHGAELRLVERALLDQHFEEAREAGLVTPLREAQRIHRRD